MKRRRIDPRKARAAVMGGIYPGPIKQKKCGKCGERRNSVDESGRCGYCRARSAVRK